MLPEINTPSSPIGSSETQDDLEILYHLHDSECKNFWELVNLLVKGMGLYLAISAAVLTYILTKEFPKDLPNVFRTGIATGGLAVTVAWGISLWWLLHGAFNQADIVTSLFHKLQGALTKTALPQTQRKLRRMAKVVVGCVYGVLLIIAIAFTSLLFRYH